MADETKLTAGLTPPQWDFVGKLVVDVLNASSAQAKMANDIWRSLQSQLQAPKPVSNGALKAVPEVEVDVSPLSPIP
jgi:hypothetical protein